MAGKKVPYIVHILLWVQSPSGTQKTARCGSYVSLQLIDLLTPEFSVAQRLEHPTSVRKVVVSIPICNPEYFSVFFSR